MLHFRPLKFTTHVPAEVLAELSSPLDCVNFGPFAHRGLPRQHQSSEAVAQRYVTCHGHDGRIDSSPGSSVRGHTGFVAMVRDSGGGSVHHERKCLLPAVLRPVSYCVILLYSMLFTQYGIILLKI